MNKNIKIAVAGTGYVGLSIATLLNPLAELSQCILDSSNGSIINVI